MPTAWHEPHLRTPEPAELAAGYLRFFEPDIFVETAPDQFELAGLDPAGCWTDRKRYFALDELVHEEPGMRPYLSAGIGMEAVYSHLFEREFQFQRRIDQKVLRFEGGTDQAAAFFEAAYGMFPKDDRLSYMARHYEGALGAEKVEPSVEAYLAIETGRDSYPLEFTVRDLETRYSDRSDPTVFVFDPSRGEDVIEFWNLRLFRPGVLPVNVHWLEQTRDVVLAAVRRNHRPLPTNRHGVMINTTIQTARSLDIDEVARVLDFKSADLPIGSATLKPWYDDIWREHDDERVFRPAAATVVAKTREAEATPSDGENHYVRVPSLAPEFNPSRFGRGPAWVNVIRTRFYGYNDRFAEPLPSAAITHRDGYPTRFVGDAFVSREGYVTFQSYARDGASLPLPTMNGAIFAWLKAEGFTAQITDAGRVAEEVIASVGGVGSMGLLADAETLKFFNSMARSRRTWDTGETDEYPDRTARLGQLERLLSGLQKRRYGGYKTVERFVDAGVLRLGLAISCTHCAKENWYGLDDVGSVVRCERCLKQFSFPQGQFPNRDIWRYRVVGPFATPNFASGAYAVGLTLRFLEHEGGSLGGLTYATGLELSKDGRKREADIFTWYRARGFDRAVRDPETIIAECKSLGTEAFKANDIERLKDFGDLFPGAYLILATLKNTLSRSEVELIKPLCKWGWEQRRAGRPVRIIVLTGYELLTLGDYHSAWAEAGGQLAEAAKRFSYIHDLATLAQATQEAHLGYSSDEMFEMMYGRARRAM